METASAPAAPLVAPHFRSLFLALFAAFTLVGTSMTIFGAALPKILADFGWDYLAAGIVLGAGAVAYFVSTFASGYLVRHVGPKPTIMLGLALAGVGLSFFATSADPLTNTLLNLIIGLGQGNLEVAVNSTTLRIDSRNTGRPMNLMHGAFAIGAILGPLLLGALLGANLSWTIIFRGMGALFLIVAAAFALLHFPEESHAPGSAGTSSARLSSRPAYWLAFVALFLYVGVELGVSNWVAEYFVRVFQLGAASSALLVSLFWGGLLAGRFGVPLVYRGSNQGAVLMSFSALATLAVVALSLLGFATPTASTDTIGFILVFLSGLGCSIFYPVVITLVGICFPHAQSQAVGFAATGGGVGAFLFPFAMSAMSQQWGIRAGFAAYGVFAVFMTVSAVLLALAARGEQSRREEVKPR